MQINIGAKVRTADGRDLGLVERVLLDWEEQRVTHFVVGHGPLPQSILVPVQVIAQAQRERLSLGIAYGEASTLPRYTPRDDNARQGPYVELATDTAVICPDGLVGTVDEVAFDPTNQGFSGVVVHGPTLDEPVLVPLDWIASASRRSVRLIVDRMAVVAATQSAQGSVYP